MSAPRDPAPAAVTLTDEEREALTSCDCGHDIGGEHNSYGCYGGGRACGCGETDDRPGVNFAAVERIVAARVAEVERERDDLLSRLGCAVEATYWDRPYEERIAAIRGMGDLTTNGLTPDPTDWKARAERAEAEVAALRGQVEAVRSVLAKWNPPSDVNHMLLRNLWKQVHAALDAEAVDR